MALAQRPKSSSRVTKRTNIAYCQRCKSMGIKNFWWWELLEVNFWLVPLSWWRRNKKQSHYQREWKNSCPWGNSVSSENKMCNGPLAKWVGMNPGDTIWWLGRVKLTHKSPRAFHVLKIYNMVIYCKYFPLF